MKFKIIEYLDGYYKDDFSDYKTKPITKWIIEGKLPYSSEIFDTSTLGGFSAYKKYLDDPKYIKQITPKEYFERCATGFNTSVDTQINQIKSDKELLDYLMDVLLIGRKSFPMPYISDSNGSIQEGRHRVYVFATLYGWNKSFPCLLLP